MKNSCVVYTRESRFIRGVKECSEEVALKRSGSRVLWATEEGNCIFEGFDSARSTVHSRNQTKNSMAEVLCQEESGTR